MHWQVEGRKEMFYLTTHSTHFIYGYMASDIWLRTILIVREETRCRHIGYSFRLAARVLLYAPSHRQDSTYHGLCYTSRGALAGTWQVEGSTSSPTGIGSRRGICTGWVFTVQITVAMHIPQQNSFTIMQLLRIYIYIWRVQGKNRRCHICKIVDIAGSSKVRSGHLQFFHGIAFHQRRPQVD